MRKYALLAAAAALVVSLSVGVATASAGGGNSANAKACQKGGWMNLAQADGTGFNNQDECVAYGASGGTPMPKPTCTAGSEDFSADADGSTPTRFTGGTIDTAYSVHGGVVVQGTSWTGTGTFPSGTHLLFTGHIGENVPFRLTFTSAVGSVQLDAEPGNAGGATVTLTAYDASDGVVGTDAATVAGAFVHLEVSSATDNIKYFTISTTTGFGTAFTNIVWDCA
jgi:hypothetical protein